MQKWYKVGHVSCIVGPQIKCSTALVQGVSLFPFASKSCRSFLVTYLHSLRFICLHLGFYFFFIGVVCFSLKPRYGVGPSILVVGFGIFLIDNLFWFGLDADKGVGFAINHFFILLFIIKIKQYWYSSSIILTCNSRLYSNFIVYNYIYLKI